MPSSRISKKIIFIFILVPLLAYSESNCSEKPKAYFKYHNPCPATGKTKGSCPGYVIDHIKPLACGGLDHQSNMQWQTKEEAKAKDKWERKNC